MGFALLNPSYALRAVEGSVHGIVIVLLQAYGIVQRNDGSATGTRAWLGAHSTTTFW